ncbi:hypothetical protein CNY89_07900 [Amaricoccus sp. HAR-UPW-R2A-40]|nr:hypothetical protein CNY89_07900 [Amaricoccus sp. HAR-UPW-R2A-40]
MGGVAPRPGRRDFAAGAGNRRVGSRLVSETGRVRVWRLTPAPGERIGFPSHVLDYFWTALTPGRARSHHGGGEVREVAYQAGDTQHHRYGPGEWMIHDLENTGETALDFVTVEFLDSANAPLAVAEEATA